jgi:hypothetical protein
MKPSVKTVALLALGAVLVACTGSPSEVDPDARIDIAGRVAHADGKAIPGVRVAMSREADLGEVFAVFATLGLACIDAHTDVCLGSRITRSGSDGRFAYRLKGKDTQGFAGTASTMVLTSAAGPRADEVLGPISTYRFQVQTEALDIPLRMWEPRLEGATGSFGARVTWQRVPATAVPGLNAATVAHEIEFRRDDEVVWTVGKARSGLAFDPRLLEDTVGSAAVTARLEDQRVSDARGRRVDLVLRSGARAYDSPAGAPPSRGRACAIADGSGRLVYQPTCALTDGDFEEDFAPSVCTGASSCSEPPHRSAVVDLGAQRSLSLIVIRGCRDRCTVETSRDAKSWRGAGIASTEDAALRVAPLVRARYVRITASTTVDGLREVSAWTGGPGVAAGPLFVDPGAITKPGGTTPPAASPTIIALDRGEGSSGWRLVALGALCAVGGALVATLLGRRKRRSPMPR